MKVSLLKMIIFALDRLNFGFAIERAWLVAQQPGVLDEQRLRQINVAGADSVEDAFVEICRAHGLDWKELKPPMRAAGRYHVETY